ncbi:MAG TPA: hypothetical protein V6D06_08445 [Trichocoleus sp.]
MDRNNFLSPRSRYYGDVKPENLVFNANLQEFSQRISLLCSLETGGKLSAAETFAQIETLWEQLKTSKESLGIGQNPFQPPFQS